MGCRAGLDAVTKRIIFASAGIEHRFSGSPAVSLITVLKCYSAGQGSMLEQR
jgi:hypothetical protein